MNCLRRCETDRVCGSDGGGCSQQFNTTTTVGRLTLNVLLSFAQFEREVTSERIRDKIAASKRKGLRVGGPLPLGYAMKDGKTGQADLPALPRTRRRQCSGARPQR